MVLGSWLEDELKKRRQRQINAAVTKARAEAHRQRMEDFQKMANLEPQPRSRRSRRPRIQRTLAI